MPYYLKAILFGPDKFVDLYIIVNRSRINLPNLLVIKIYDRLLVQTKVVGIVFK